MIRTLINFRNAVDWVDKDLRDLQDSQMSFIIEGVIQSVLDGKKEFVFSYYNDVNLIRKCETLGFITVYNPENSTITLRGW